MPQGWSRRHTNRKIAISVSGELSYHPSGNTRILFAFFGRPPAVTLLPLLLGTPLPRSRLNLRFCKYALTGNLFHSLEEANDPVFNPPPQVQYPTGALRRGYVNHLPATSVTYVGELSDNWLR